MSQLTLRHRAQCHARNHVTKLFSDRLVRILQEADEGQESRADGLLPPGWKLPLGPITGYFGTGVKMTGDGEY